MAKEIKPFDERLFDLIRKEMGVSIAIEKVPELLKFLGK